MLRARKRIFPSNPNDLHELVIQGGFGTTGGINPVRYLLHDNGPANPLNSRIVFFSTDEDLRCVVNISASNFYYFFNFKKESYSVFLGFFKPTVNLQLRPI